MHITYIFNREVSGKDCESSSRKEVWAWVIRSTALYHKSSVGGDSDGSSEVDGHQQKTISTEDNNDTSLFDSFGFKKKELLALADRVEHTSVCDQLLSGNIDEDITKHELQYFESKMKEILDQLQQWSSSTSTSPLKHLPNRCRKQVKNPTEGSTTANINELETNKLDNMETLLHDALSNVLNSLYMPENKSRLNVLQDSNGQVIY